MAAEANKGANATDSITSFLAVVGLWSHMAYADAPTHPTIGAQVAVFEEAVEIARGAGLTEARRHLEDIGRDQQLLRSCFEGAGLALTLASAQ